MAYPCHGKGVVELEVVVEPARVAYEQAEHEGPHVLREQLFHRAAHEVRELHREAQEAAPVAPHILRLAAQVCAQEDAARGVDIRLLAVALQRGDEFERELRQVARSQLRHQALVVVYRGLDARQALLLYAQFDGGVALVAHGIVQDAGGHAQLAARKSGGRLNVYGGVGRVPAQA